MAKRDDSLERKFLTIYRQLCGKRPIPEREFRFATGVLSDKGRPRQWRFDFAWPAAKLAIEIDGGIFVGGGHNRGLQFTGDCDKINTAIELGWRVLRYTTLSLREKPVQCVEQVLRVLDQSPSGKYQKELLET